jgi:hypothetical protein
MSPRPDSQTARLAALQIGQGYLLPTALDRYAKDMRQAIPPRTRRPAELAGMEFAATLFTCVSARKAGDVRYAIWIERVA